MPVATTRAKASMLDECLGVLNSLSDAAFRLTYDAKLAAARIPASAPEAALSLVPIAADDANAANAANASNEVRADAMSPRADALSLRADAMMLRTQGASPRAQPADMARKVASSTMAGFQYLSRAVGLLVIVGATAFGLTRCMNGDSSDYRARLEAEAAEKTAVQEYFQTHGVRPANMAELELLEAEREARQFEEDARKRGLEVSRDLQLAEERAERARQFEAKEQQVKERAAQAEKKADQQAEERRAERQQQQWRDIIQR
jgi:hypothetical protein